MTRARPEPDRLRGLPGPLPPGERLIWQASPRWTRLACEAFHVRLVAAYFAAMIAWRAAQAVGAGAAPAQVAAAAASTLPLAALALALLTGFAWLTARTTVYTLTNRRVVLSFGAALPKAVNLPLSIVESGALKTFAGGEGDVALTLKVPNKLALLHIWPHARPGRIAAPQPTLRAVPDAARVARLVAAAVDAAAGAEIAPAAAPSPAPERRRPERTPDVGRPAAAAA